ncbi:MAG: winged helix-turn-helix transcriptional regulator [Thermofilaceae archaeon]
MASLVDEHSLRLLKAIKETGRARFKDLRAFVPNPRTLSAKLKLLSELGLVERDGPSYSLTELGEKAVEKLTEVEGIAPRSPEDPERREDTARLLRPTHQEVLREALRSVWR